MNNLRFYRATNNNSGFASEWSLGEKKDSKYDRWMVFLSIAKQIPSDTEDAKFEWKDNLLKVKLGQNDIGEILATLLNFQPNINNGKGLFHQTERGMKVINLSQNEKGGFYLKIFFQSTDKKETDTRQLSISNGETQVLRVFLEECLKVLQS